MELDNTIWLPFTYVAECSGQWTTSTANLERTPIKFSPSVLPYHATGWEASGGAVLSSNNQIMTITTKGQCASTYFADYESRWDLIVGDDHPVVGQSILPVT